MTLISKYTIGKDTSKQFIVNKNFTDRELPKNAFENQIQNLLEEQKTGKKTHRVLTYYGIGGIGKSTLLKELKRITSLHKSLFFSSVDLANIPNQSTARMLLELSRSFSDKNIELPHFSIAYAIYFQRSNKDIIYNQKKKIIFDENLGMVADILSIIDGLGILGVIPNIVNKLYESAHKLSLHRDIKDDLKRLELMDISDIENLLPEFWAYDINDYLNLNQEKRMLIFIDTYEALWNAGKNDINRFSRDQSIRGLITELPGTLFVISGRESIEWEEIEPSWGNVLEQHLLEKLEGDYANEFLLGCNILDADIREQIISVSMGHPYYLELFVDTYVEMKNASITPQKELFAKNKREILECFFKYMQNEEIEVIKILSVTRYYNFSLFKHLLLELPIGYPVTKFDEFNKFSFISQLTEENYHIHELMRKEVLDFIPKKLFATINKIIIKYYNACLTDETSYEKTKLFIKESIYHYNKILNPQDFQSIIAKQYIKYLKDFQFKGESLYLFDILNDVFLCVEYSMNEELFEIYSDMVMLTGDFRKAVDLINKYLENYDINKIANDSKLLHLYVKKVKHQMTYEATGNTIALIESIEAFIDSEVMARQYIELIYTKANMLIIQGNYIGAKEILNRVIDLSKNNNLHDLQCRALRKISDSYLYEKKKEKDADSAYTEGINLARKNGYDRYAYYLECTKAEIYRKLKLFEQAKNTFLNCETIFNRLGTMPWVAHSNLGLSLIEIEKGNYSNAQDLLYKAENIYIKTQHTWGKIHTKLIQLQCEYMKENTFKANEVEYLKKECKKMGYNDVLAKIYALEKGQIVITNLCFL
jgi:hypothetical protein